nr:metallopeptidase family protein [Propionibacterium sp.]
MAFEMSPDEFDAAVERAIDDIPDELFGLLANCVIVVEDDAPPEEPDLLGLYEGVPLTERDTGYGAVLPDRIRIFRRPILDLCETADEVEDEVYVTVVHEIAHFFGIDDDRLHELGWA